MRVEASRPTKATEDATPVEPAFFVALPFKCGTLVVTSVENHLGEHTRGFIPRIGCEVQQPEMVSMLWS